MRAKRVRSLALLATIISGVVSADAATIQVTIENLSISPVHVRAELGDTIEWINKDALAHTATVKGGWEVTIPPNTIVSKTLDEDGPIDYYCRFHPNMKGSIFVNARQSD